MPNLYFFPCVDPGAEIIPEKQYIAPSGGLYGYVELETGVTIALRGDGTGTGDDGETVGDSHTQDKGNSDNSQKTENQ